MPARSLRYRLHESSNLWPGFVDVLATLLIVIIFVLMVFTVSQIYLSDAISGRDKALESLRNQINELSKILVIESKEKEKVLSELKITEDTLTQSKENLQKQESYSKELQANISEKDSELFIQEQNIIALSNQIKDLLSELRIVANALEAYEGAEITSFNTEGLGERINKALASRIDQLKNLNTQLSQLNDELENVKFDLQSKVEELNKSNSDLMAINESLGLEDADLINQLAAIQRKNELLEISQKETQTALELIQRKNELLEISQKETQTALELIEKANDKLAIKDEALQKQILQYQMITKDLLAINDSLGLKDATLVEQLEAIRSKNQKLSELNLNLVKRDDTIFSLRGKILELNNILALSEEKQLTQEKELSNLNQSLNLLETEKTKLEEESALSIAEMEKRSDETFKQVASLSQEIEVLKKEISLLNEALESSEQSILSKELKIEVLGERLNKALTSKVFELQKYRSEFFGKLKSILGDREDIKIVGDRFIFESELLFDSASASLQPEGMDKLKQIGLTLKETTNNIPQDIDWIIQVEGHTDKRPINTIKYPSNWELSTARANSVLKLLLNLGFSPNRLSAAGYGEFYPISEDDSVESLQQNRRIELKLTSR